MNLRRHAAFAALIAFITLGFVPTQAPVQSAKISISSTAFSAGPTFPPVPPPPPPPDPIA